MNRPHRPQALPLVVLLTLAACGSEPSSTPPPGPPADASQPAADLGAVDAPPLPCNGACGPGTVCEGGRCVLADAGAVDVSPGIDARPLEDVAPLEDLGADRAPVVDVSPGVDVLEDRAAVPPPDLGPCGMCSYPNARAECSPSGACSLVGCLAGFGDCDGRNSNGCETSFNEAANCGACDNRCPSGVRCINGRCDTCAASERWCAIVGSGQCTPADDPRNCGQCGNACPSTMPCMMGRCVNPCPSGRTYCQSNIDLNIACVDLQTGRREGSVTVHCGTCGHTCAEPRSGCIDGMCVR